MQSKRILVADDDSAICNLIKLVLEKDGYSVCIAENGKQVVDIISENNSFDLIILDIVMPMMFGTDAAIEIRKRCTTPIMFLTARSTDADKITAYDAGADDYLCKPFSTIELSLRVKAILRRTASEEEITFMPERSTVIIDGKRAELTGMEYKLFEYFYDNKGKTLDVETIFTDVWCDRYMPSSNNTVMVFILNLRKKIEADYTQPKHIKTVWGKGYKYV